MYGPGCLSNTYESLGATFFVEIRCRHTLPLRAGRAHGFVIRNELHVSVFSPSQGKNNLILYLKKLKVDKLKLTHFSQYMSWGLEPAEGAKSKVCDFAPFAMLFFATMGSEKSKTLLICKT